MLVPHYQYFSIEQELTFREGELFPVGLGKDEAFLITEIAYQARGTTNIEYECGVLLDESQIKTSDDIMAKPNAIACVEGVYPGTGLAISSHEPIVTFLKKIPIYIWQPGFSPSNDHFGVVVTIHAETVRLTDAQYVALNRRKGIARAYHIFEE